MWTDTNINFGKQTIRHCCKQEAMPLGLDELTKFKSEVFENHPLNIANKKQMVEQDQLPASCQWCINTEPNSIKHVWNEWSDEFIKEQGGTLVNDSHIGYIELDIGTSCDMACVYCGPWASSTWAKELGVSSKAPDKEANDEWHEKVLQYLSEYILTIPNSRQLTFNILGGEPLLIAETYKIIEYIATRCSHFEKKPILMITTNLNCKPKLLERLMDTIQNTSHIFNWVISISIENIDKQAEAVRYHLDWKRFENNITTIKDHVDRIYLTTTFSILSFAQFGEFIAWAFGILGTDTYTKTWDFSLNSVQEGYTDIAYCDASLVDIDHIKTVYQHFVSKCDSPEQWRIDQIDRHLDNLYSRLGTKPVNAGFVSFWTAISNRRSINYFEMYPLDRISKSYNDQLC